MSENKHTAEPWAVKGAAIRTADGIGIDVIATMQVSNQPFWDEDARRIVACVNACAGISTENLEDNLPVKELARRYNKALKQRDKLLAALDGAKHSFSLIRVGLTNPRDTALSAIQKIDVAIASVKGEQ